MCCPRGEIVLQTVSISLQTSSRPPGLDAGPLLEAVIEATRRTQMLLAPDRLQRTVDAMVGRAHAFGVSAVYGASEAGFFLAGAMAHQSEQLRLWKPEDREAVHLVDGVIVGLGGLHVATHQIKSIGARRVDALVLALLDPSDWARSGELGSYIAMSDVSRAAA